MKKHWFLFILLLSCLSLCAQTRRSNAIFLSVEGFAGNYFGTSIDLNYQLRQRFSLSMGINGFARTVQENERCYPKHDRVFDYHFLVGKVFPYNHGKVRWNLAFGIAGSHATHPVSYWKDELNERNGFIKNGIWFGDPVYRAEHEESRHIAFIVHPGIEVIITKSIGLTFSGLYIGDHMKPVVGAGVGIIVGKLR